MIWSKKHNLEACRGCGTDEQPHHALGLCKQCYTQQYYEQNRERIIARKQRWYEENVEKMRAYGRDYQHRRYKENPAGYNAHVKQWREENPHKWCAIAWASRARKAGVDGEASGEQIAARVEYYGEKCYLCGDDYEGISHVIPMSRGGGNWPCNIRPICKSCRSSKRNKTLYEHETMAIVPNGAARERYGKGWYKVDYKSEIEVFFREVMEDLGYEGWTLRWQKVDAFCWRKRKVIDISPTNSVDECKQMLLHEIAHIDIVVHGNQHIPRFWEWLGSLVAQYLGQGLSGYQKVMLVNYCPEMTGTDLYLT